MKRFLLVCSLALLSASTVVAQQSSPTDTKTAEQQVYNKRLFSSKISELSAYASRKTPHLVDRSIKQLDELIDGALTSSKKKVSELEGADKAAAKEIYDRQVVLAKQIQPLTTDAMKNIEKLKLKLREFEATL